MNYVFTSNWFYDAQNIGVKIKSPIELLVGVQTTIHVEIKNDKAFTLFTKNDGANTFLSSKCCWLERW